MIIQFRNKAHHSHREPELWNGHYRLNADGWYRLHNSLSGADGHGLMIRKAKINSRYWVGHFDGESGDWMCAFKASIDYVRSDWDGNPDTENAHIERGVFWMIVNDPNRIDDEVSEINSEIDRWNP